MRDANKIKCFAIDEVTKFQIETKEPISLDFFFRFKYSVNLYLYR